MGRKVVVNNNLSAKDFADKANGKTRGIDGAIRKGVKAVVKGGKKS